jgi:signal transduction histidine kinase
VSTVARRLAWVAAPVLTLLCYSPLVMAGAHQYVWGMAATPGPLYPLALGEMSLSLVNPVVLWGHLATERRTLERRQLTLVLFASTVAGLALIDVLPVIGIDAPPVDWMPLLTAAFMLLAAIVRHRLLDIRLAMQRSILWVGLTILGALPFAFVGLLLAPRLSAGRPLPLALVFAALLFGMRAYLQTVQPRIDDLVGRRSRDLESELEDLADQAATLKTSEELGRAADRFLAALDRRLAALVVIDEKGRPRVAVSAWGSVPPPSRSSPLLAELSRVRSLVARDAAAGPVRIEIERACVRWGAEYLGPLLVEELLLGVVAISPRQAGGIADAVELEALDRMCVTLTAALAGARLYERLHELSAELEQKAEARGKSLAQALSDLRGAEQRLVEGEKLASLGQIVAGVAADLGDEVRRAHEAVAPLERDAEALFAAADRARKLHPMEDDRFDEMARDLHPLLGAVAEGARRAHAIAQDLSRFAPDENEATRAELRRPVHLAALIDTTLTLVTHHLDDVAVVRDYDETLPAVEVEAGPLGQVILNLVLNATQAMRGSGTLTLATRRTATHAELSVADTGPGIPADVLPRIFEPFFSTKGPQAGTGLGLSISYGIVKRHGGQIHVESKTSIGTTFRVQLPLSTGVG